MANPEVSPQRMWDGELEPEDDREYRPAGALSRADTSYRWVGGVEWGCCGGWVGLPPNRSTRSRADTSYWLVVGAIWWMGASAAATCSMRKGHT